MISLLVPTGARRSGARARRCGSPSPILLTALCIICVAVPAHAWWACRQPSLLQLPGFQESRIANPALVSSVGPKAQHLEEALEDDLFHFDGVRAATVRVYLPEDGFAPPGRAVVAFAVRPGVRYTAQQRQAVVDTVAMMASVRRKDVTLYFH